MMQPSRLCTVSTFVGRPANTGAPMHKKGIDQARKSAYWRQCLAPTSVLGAVKLGFLTSIRTPSSASCQRFSDDSDCSWFPAFFFHLIHTAKAPQSNVA